MHHLANLFVFFEELLIVEAMFWPFFMTHKVFLLKRS